MASSASVRKPARARDGADLAARRAPRDELVDLRVELEDLHDRHAAPVSDVLAARAADRLEDGPALVLGHAEQVARAVVGLVGRLAMGAELAHRGAAR
jgi:hypothetical protein